MESTVLVPAEGGTYIEGSVGQFQPLNPWFAVENNVNRDIVSLIFSGLLRYNPDTKAIEDDLAALTISRDKRVYSLVLRRDLFWHDSTKEQPHPITSDDILFTFKSIQDPTFPNPLLRQNFQGVTIDKIDDRTVKFTLSEPYSFFASNLTLGLLPKNAFEGVPVSKLDQVLDFGYKPVGSGPYAFKSLTQTDISTEVTLERFPRVADPAYHLKRVVFRIFSDYTALLSDVHNLDGVRMVPRSAKGEPLVPRRFTALNYTLPQYVALFFNLDRPFLQDRKLRLGLQMGTNKQEVIDTIGEKTIVDTPLLELNTADWKYKFDAAAAQGALFESNWNLPEKVRLQRLLEMNDANSKGLLHIDPVLLLDSGSLLTVTGSLVNLPEGGKLNGISLKQSSNSGTWIVMLPTVGTGSVKIGMNHLRLTDAKGATVDSAYAWRTTDIRQFRRAVEEQSLLRLFLATRNGINAAGQTITVSDLALDGGMLRRRTPDDPVDTRINEHGNRLELRLLTSSAPESYRTVAKSIQAQWAKLGVKVILDIPDTRDGFEQKLITRDFDILLFGQSLLDNLDCYPYWHSDGMQKLTGSAKDLRLDAFNFSQYSSLMADGLLREIRQTFNEKERQSALKDLRRVLGEDVPAVFLYTPLYTYAFSQDVHGISLSNVALHSDRFLTLKDWFVKQKREFKPNAGWLGFIPWLLTFSFR